MARESITFKDKILYFIYDALTIAGGIYRGPKSHPANHLINHVIKRLLKINNLEFMRAVENTNPVLYETLGTRNYTTFGRVLIEFGRGMAGRDNLNFYICESIDQFKEKQKQSNQS